MQIIDIKISSGRRLIRFFLRLLSGKYRHLRKRININKAWCGSNYGGFFVCPQFLNQNSIIYSFGIGEDISFDKCVIEKYDCTVFAFDPTPKSVNWIKRNPNIPYKFNFFEYGIADRSGIVDFYLPKNADHVSGSFINQLNVNVQEKVQVQMRCWKDILAYLAHKKVDVLKMDIEGAEYNVLDQILESSIPIGQILIEFHERFFDNGKIRSIEAIRKLNAHGFEIFGVSDTYEEISFINTALLN